jgi:predicted Rossmann-fold nucleotide-binding protein
MSMQNKRPCVSVIGSGTEKHSQISEPLGRWLAEQGCNLINGGGGGVMEAVSQAFAGSADRKGSVIGIIPSSNACDTPEARSAYTSPKNYPNAWVDIPIYTHLPLSGTEGKNIASRNHIIILSSDVILAFPGGAGTRSEIQLALEYGKPLLILSPNHEWDEFKNTQAALAEKPAEAIRWLAKNIPQIS